MLLLRELIESKDYLSRLENIEKTVGNIAGKTRILFPKYTNHGVDHLKNVERHANNIIPDNIKEKLSEEEIFCLLCGIWLHDIGMVPIDEEIDIYENKSKEDRNKYRNDIRDIHHIRSENYILKNYNELGLNKLEAKIIGKISKSHRQVDLKELDNIVYNGKLINVALLGSIIRLADECDISKDRETSLSSEGIDENTIEKHYSIHDLVHDIWIDHENNTIYLSCHAENEYEIIEINKRKDEIQKKLNQTRPYLNKTGIKLKYVKLDIHEDLIYEKEIICKIANYDFNIEEWDIHNINQTQIHEILENLTAENLFNSNDYTLGFKETFNTYKKLFEKFLGYYNLKNFFFTDYSQKMIEPCFGKIENKFNAKFLSERNSRINILKNTPTAFYLILIFEELIGDNKFRLNYNKNGDLIIDFLLLMSIFNDNYYFNEEIDFKNVKKHINHLIEDKNDIQSKIEKISKFTPEIHPNDDEHTIPLSINLNIHEKFNDLMNLNPTPENPIKIVGDRINYIEIGEGDEYRKYTPDMIIISNDEKLEIKINNKTCENFKFEKDIISKNEVLFTSKSSEELPCILKIKFYLNEDNFKISLSFIPKSNKIKDILNKLKFERKCSEKNFEIKYQNKTLLKDKFPKIIIDKEQIKFFEKINVINDYFELNMIYDEDYEIKKTDIENAKLLCDYIKNKKIHIKTIESKIEITTSKLNELLQHETKETVLFNSRFEIDLLNKNIGLKEFNVKINSLKIINKKDLLHIVNTHNPDEIINTKIIMGDEKSDLILDFNTENI